VVKRNKKAQKQREMEAERLNNEWDLWCVLWSRGEGVMVNGGRG
jgi:hypothetical protein